MTHLLDSSAFFAFFFGERGAGRVAALFQDSAAEIGVCALTAVELSARLKAAGRDEAFEEEWNAHLPLFSRVVACDLTLCLRAGELRRAAKERLPTIDALIAAGASLADATLVHRDPHFGAIPGHLLRQEVIG